MSGVEVIGREGRVKKMGIKESEVGKSKGGEKSRKKRKLLR